jgi:DNA-binding NtrC family response regulator
MKLLYDCEMEVAKLLRSILVIDDEVLVRDMLTKVLEEEGYTVDAVENGKNAVKICENQHFDAALIDINLPDINGTDLLGKLKAIKPKMVRIIITGHPSVENAVKAVNEKSDGYILKPFSIPQLLETIKKLIDEKTNEYFQMFTEVEKARKETPLFKYQTPDKW